MSFRLREEHISLMTDFMENHPDFATGRLSASNARAKFRELWQELTNSLNALGFGTRAVDKWQKTWTDYKANLKKKASEIKRYQETTGGGPEINKKLTDLELRILSILGQTFYAGCGVMEHGLQEKNVSVDTNKLSISKGVDMGDITVDINSPSSSKVIPGIPEAKRKSYDTSHSDKKYEIDHDYLISSTPLSKKRKRAPKASDMNLVYEDTINVLKSIENTVGSGLQNFESTVSNKLDALRQTIQEGFHNINITLKTCFKENSVFT